MADEEKFEIIFDKADDNTVIATSFEESLSQAENKMVAEAFNNFKNKPDIYSAYTKEARKSSVLTFDVLRDLIVDVHSNLSKVMALNEIVRRFIISDDIIGKTYESFESNLNTEYKLSFGRYDSHRNKKKRLESIKKLLDDFNNEINLKQLIRDSVPLTFAEGNYIMYLRSVGDGYIVDHYPLGIAFISDYTCNGKPVVCIDMRELQSRLSKTYLKDKKNKALFFKSIEEEIKNNYPDEVYQAFLKKEPIAKLDSSRTGVMRIGNMGRKYGVSPIVRALRAALMLENIEDADFINNKAKAKKIIHQVLNKEIMGTNYEKKCLSDAAYAHSELMKAWKNKTVVYTSTPAVQKIVYVEPSTEDTPADKVNLYRSKIMTTLGIGFIDSNIGTFSVANISLEQLMKTINSISEQLERILVDFYRVVFEKNGIEKEFLPYVKIIDAEQLSLAMKKDLVELLYTKLNCSLESALDILGYNIEDEKQRRIKENDEGIDEIFFPRQTSYTASSDKTGRPTGNDDVEKQVYDTERNGQ